MPGGTHCTLQDHLLARCQRGASPRGLRRVAATRRPVSRAEEQPLKQQLPFPYNQDLSKVLRHLNRRTPFGRAKLANDPVTAAYIAAATRLVRRHLGPGAERQQADCEDQETEQQAQPFAPHALPGMRPELRTDHAADHDPMRPVRRARPGWAAMAIEVSHCGAGCLPAVTTFT